ncbi:MAG TPA: methyltransferase domain-containing protein [Thiobacillaceae bacterium]|nr:methyltransferase domain-containing protein [Thiobacillaceae bacterium]
MMSGRDPHRFVNELAEEALDRLVARLESRAKDAVFSRLFEKYSARLALSGNVRVLEVGCGTGAALRMLARQPGFSGHACGIDQSAHFIAAANRFAQSENLAEHVVFQQGDAHGLAFPDASFDVVFAHTLVSHAADPAGVLREMARVVRPGGTVAIFDGDYSSLAYAYPDHAFGRRMNDALATATFNNPLIMHDLPRLLREHRLAVAEAWGDAVVEIGSGSYFKSFAETYVPYVKRAQVLPVEAVDEWLDYQLYAMDEGFFFAACNYYTYLAQRT